MPTSFQAVILAMAVLPAQDPAQAPAQAPAPQSDRRNWTEVRSVESGFLVEFPVAPKQADRSVKGEDGKMIPARVWSAEIDRGWTAYFVGFSDISTARRQSATSDVILGDAVQGALKETPGSVLVSETPIQFQGHPGRDVALAANDGKGAYRIRARIVLVGLRLYQQIAVTSDSSKLEPGEVDRYFKSFLLLAR